MSECVLIDDIVNITNCLVIFYPSPVCYFQLTISNKLSYFGLHFSWDGIIPVFQKYYLSYKIFPFRISFKRSIHWVEYCFGISLIHCIEKSCWPEVEIFEFIVSVEPKSIHMRVKSNKKLLVVGLALLSVNESYD